MSTSRLILSYPEGNKEIRTIYRDGEVLFCLADVVALLAEQNTTLAQDGKKIGLAGLTKALLDALDSDEKHSITEIELSNPKDAQFVTQPGLFRIILRDNSPACKKFQRWVFHEVLPSIQRYGTYPPPAVPQGSEVKKAVMLLLDEIEERERLERETKERFLITEKKLNELSKRLVASTPTSGPSLSYFTISEYCQSQKIDHANSQLFQGWCIKICAEDGYYSHKIIIEGKEEISFPEPVLLKARSMIFNTPHDSASF